MKKLLLLVFGLAGCAAPVDRSPFLNSLVGQPETDLVRRLGVPTRTYETSGHRFLAYQERQTSIVGTGVGFGDFGGLGYGGYGGFGYGGFGGFGTTFSNSRIVERVCETTFDVAGGRVVTWSLRGNACT